MQPMGFRLWADLDGGLSAGYSAFEIQPKAWNLFTISHEHCVLNDSSGKIDEFERQDGKFTKPVPALNPAILPDRLALQQCSPAQNRSGFYGISSFA